MSEKQSPDLTVTEAAALLQISRQAVHVRYQAGRFPGAYVAPNRGKLQIYIPRADVVREREEETKKALARLMSLGPLP